jgi:putative addiction module component (TIGR02574 family)
MQRSYEEARRIALGLLYHGREKLSQELWESLHPPADDLPQEEIDAAWDEEIRRRLNEIDSGAVQMIPADHVRSEMIESLSRAARARLGV